MLINCFYIAFFKELNQYKLGLILKSVKQQQKLIASYCKQKQNCESGDCVKMLVIDNNSNHRSFEESGLQQGTGLKHCGPLTCSMNTHLLPQLPNISTNKIFES
ncbi:hypothetical protein NPIL_171131 [Nephila pilipes]|uniref:Uncharacterized protein n=1 Tax=Nephila pilipes TaxID=299642 RepID=A0A8X6MBB6_NEPPI|nr:hypothetical protein NPIL_171131 [Nephila pilipes]